VAEDHFPKAGPLLPPTAPEAATGDAARRAGGEGDLDRRAGLLKPGSCERLVLREPLVAVVRDVDRPRAMVINHWPG